MIHRPLRTGDFLLGATFAFWQHGFKRTDMERLAEAMDVNASDVSSALGSKRDVFIRSLELYFENLEADLAGLSDTNSDAVDAVSTIVDFLIAAARKPAFARTEWRGCLLGNTALEFGTDDTAIIERLSSGVRVFRTQFKRALLASPVGRGVSDSAVDRVVLQLLATLQGLLILARCGLTDDEIASIRTTMIANVASELREFTLMPRGPRRNSRRRNEPETNSQ